MATPTAVTTSHIKQQIALLDPDEQEGMLIRLLRNMADDPSQMAFPALLPVELALKIDTPENICKAYDIGLPQFRKIVEMPVFIKAYQEAIENLKTDGMSFKMKAKMQAEDYLGTTHSMVKDPNTADAVRADLIKSTVRWAGYEAKAADANAGASFNIQINL
jgi:hypothetical protein